MHVCCACVSRRVLSGCVEMCVVRVLCVCVLSCVVFCVVLWCVVSCCVWWVRARTCRALGGFLSSRNSCGVSSLVSFWLLGSKNAPQREPQIPRDDHSHDGTLRNSWFWTLWMDNGVHHLAREEKKVLHREIAVKMLRLRATARGCSHGLVWCRWLCAWHGLLCGRVVSAPCIGRNSDHASNTGSFVYANVSCTKVV